MAISRQLAVAKYEAKQAIHNAVEQFKRLNQGDNEK